MIEAALLRRGLLLGALSTSALGCQGPARPDLLVVVLDTTTPGVVAEAMPNAQAFLDASRRWERAVAPSNSTVESVGGMFQGRFLRGGDLVPQPDSTAEVTLAEELSAAGYGTLLVSANEALDHPLFAAGFDAVVLQPRGEDASAADADAADAFVSAWEATEPPRFGWIQLLAGHDYLGRAGEAPWPPTTAEELERAWGWYSEDAGRTDGLLPALFALNEPGVTAVVADHGELFPDRAPFMVAQPGGEPRSFGHGEANSPAEIEVPFGLRGEGVIVEVLPGAVSTLGLRDTLLRAAGRGEGADLRTEAAARPAGSVLCNLLNLEVPTEQSGNMTVWVEADGSQLVRTHAPEPMPPEDRPPLLLRWPAQGVGFQPSGQPLQLSDLSAAQTRLLFDDGLAQCKGFRDLCDDYPELGAIGYIDCD